jgi:hypothetical protein
MDKLESENLIKMIFLNFCILVRLNLDRRLRNSSLLKCIKKIDKTIKKKIVLTTGKDIVSMTKLSNNTFATSSGTTLTIWDNYKTYNYISQLSSGPRCRPGWTEWGISSLSALPNCDLITGFYNKDMEI